VKLLCNFAVTFSDEVPEKQFRKLSTIAILASTLSTVALSAEMVTVDNFPTAETNEIMRANPPEAALYEFGAPQESTSEEFYTIDVKDVPVDGFWSITVYNADGFMEPNAMGINSYNNVTAKANGDGGYTINFGGCDDGRINGIPVTKGWNYAVRLYQPQQVLLDGGWTFPVAVPAQ
jgi:hypothetical protein